MSKISGKKIKEEEMMNIPLAMDGNWVTPNELTV